MNDSGVLLPTLLLFTGIGLAVYSANQLGRDFLVPSTQLASESTTVGKPIAQKASVKPIETPRIPKADPPEPSKIEQPETKVDPANEVIALVDDETKKEKAPENDAPNHASNDKRHQTACAPQFTIMFEREIQFLSSFEDESKELVAWLKDHPEEKVIVKGHADGKGNEMYNLKLSHRRATKVADALKKKGLTRARMTVQAFGEYQPDAELENKTNRRVVVRVKGKEPCKDKK